MDHHSMHCGARYHGLLWQDKLTSRDKWTVEMVTQHSSRRPGWFDHLSRVKSHQTYVDGNVKGSR